MSTSTTTGVANMSLHALRLIERDYTVCRTGNGDSSTDFHPSSILPTAPVAQSPLPDGLIDPTTAPHPRLQGIVSPAWWPSNRFRRVPDYAPVNHKLDMSERPAGENAIVGFFLVTTFVGCHFLSVGILLVAYWYREPGKNLKA